jgi:hypothetical protein
MSDLRSRTGVVGATTGAVLLALPVCAWGQVPALDQVVGGMNQAAQGVVQRAAALPPRAPAPAQAPAPRPAPAPTAAAPAAPAPASSAPARSATVTASQASGGSPATSTSGHKSSKRSTWSSGVRAHAADKKAAAADDATATDTQIADDPASAPQDASLATLPFTGLQLALMLMAGLAALTAGVVLRRTVR